MLSDIKETEVGAYVICFTPPVRGCHQLKVQANGVEICGSPFLFQVFPTLETRGKPVKILSSDLTKAWGVAVNKEGIVAIALCDAHCIAIFSEKGEKLRTFGHDRLRYPRGVAYDGDASIIVTSNHRLQKFTLEGECLMSIGSDTQSMKKIAFQYLQQTVHLYK